MFEKICFNIGRIIGSTTDRDLFWATVLITMAMFAGQANALEFESYYGADGTVCKLTERGLLVEHAEGQMNMFIKNAAVKVSFVMDDGEWLDAPGTDFENELMIDMPTQDVDQFLRFLKRTDYIFTGEYSIPIGDVPYDEFMTCVFKR